MDTVYLWIFEYIRICLLVFFQFKQRLNILGCINLQEHTRTRAHTKQYTSYFSTVIIINIANTIISTNEYYNYYYYYYKIYKWLQAGR